MARFCTIADAMVDCNFYMFMFLVRYFYEPRELDVRAMNESGVSQKTQPHSDWVHSRSSIRPSFCPFVASPYLIVLVQSNSSIQRQLQLQHLYIH
jgi:hypothetical protein